MELGEAVADEAGNRFDASKRAPAPAREATIFAAALVDRWKTGITLFPKREAWCPRIPRTPLGAKAPAKEDVSMHPGFYRWWHGACCEDEVCFGMPAGYGPSCGPSFGGHFAGGGWAEGGDFGSGSFGVRRPLRFLAYKLDLSEQQVGDLAKILDELKTERAQGEVDRRRTVAAFADAVGGATFDGKKAQEGAALRVQSAERLRDAVLKALERIHGVLDEAQRGKLAYLIRTGTLSI